MAVKILYVDDNQDDIFLMNYSFKKYKDQAELYIFTDGRDFLSFVNKENGYKDRPPLKEPCCLLLDINMPYLNGFEVLEKLKNSPDTQMREIPVIMFSSSYRDSDREKGKSLGAVDHIKKPFCLSEMSEVLNMLVTCLNSKLQ